MANNHHSNSKSLSNQVSYLFFGNLFARLLGLLAPLIMVRLFSKQDYGIYLQTFLICIFLTRIFQFGFRNGLYYHLSNDNDQKDIYITNTIILFLFLGTINLNIGPHNKPVIIEAIAPLSL